MKRHIVVALLAVAVLASVAVAEDPVYFADANLKAAVETALGKTNPTPTDVLALTELNAWGKSITSLVGLEYATNATWLNLYGNDIADVSPLSALPTLIQLDLGYNSITDIHPLMGLTTLTRLTLLGNKIADFSPLAGLTDLTELNLSDNDITNITSLTGLPSLTHLWLNDNSITDFTPLVALPSLTYLDLSNNGITDISALAGLPNLTELHLYGNTISDLGPLAGLTNLTVLWLMSNTITDISPLAGLINLTDFTAFGNDIADISPLAGLTRLTNVGLVGNEVTDISPLASLGNLACVQLPGNDIRDISPLVGLTSLTCLTLDNNPLNRDAYCHDLPAIANDNPGLQWDTYAFSFSPNRNPPEGVSATNGTYADKVVITWEALCPGPPHDPWTPPDTFAYQVYRSTSLSGSKALVSGSDWLESTSFEDTTASPGIHCYYWIKAKGNYFSIAGYSGADEGWVRGPDRTLTISSSTGGSVSTPGEGPFICADGTVASVAATPGTNYHFVNWTGTAVDAGKVANPDSASTTITMDADYALQANFAVNRHRLTITCGQGGSVQTTVGLGGVWQTWEGEMSEVLDAGSEVTITATPQAGWCFANWSGNVWAVDNPLRFTLTGDRDLEAHFALNPRELVITSGQGGSVVLPGEGTFHYATSTVVQLTAAADPNYCFVHWTGTAVDANKVADVNAPETTVVVDGDYTLAANFESELDTLYVGQGGSDDPNADGTQEHPLGQVQDAILVAAEGSRVVIGSGTYTGPLDLLGKAIELTGPDPNDPSSWPVIDAQGAGPVLSFTHGEGADTVVRGLILTGGKGDKAGAIYCSGSSPTISNCLIVGNRATDPNSGAVYCEDSNAAIINCTIGDNCSGSNGAGVYLLDSPVVLSSSILWDNSPAEITVAQGPGPTVAYSDIAGGWSGTGSLSADPQFALPGYWTDLADPDAIWTPGDYHLLSQAGRWDPAAGAWVEDPMTSPCVDAGGLIADWTAEPTPNGGRINMGAFGGTAEASKSYLTEPVGP